MERVTRLDQVNVKEILNACKSRNKPNHHLSDDEIVAAYVRTSCRGTRWDNKTGRLLDIKGELSRYSIQSEFEPHSNEEGVIEWEFVPIVRGDAVRFRNCIAAGVKY